VCCEHCGEEGIKIEKKVTELLNIIQKDFPVESRPFLKIGNKIGMSEDEVIELIKLCQDKGYIRRFGGIFDSKNLGYVNTLCAMSVPDSNIEEIASIVNCYPGVTHNYLRNHTYNMWFTVTAISRVRLEEVIEEIRNKTHIHNIMVLNSLNTFKIKVNFNL
jgi:DNA-binding Lrp family transcriptional regulator